MLRQQRTGSSAPVVDNSEVTAQTTFRAGHFTSPAIRNIPTQTLDGSRANHLRWNRPGQLFPW
jgi:hypothetical protein